MPRMVAGWAPTERKAAPQEDPHDDRREQQARRRRRRDAARGALAHGPAGQRIFADGAPCAVEATRLRSGRLDFDLDLDLGRDLLGLDELPGPRVALLLGLTGQDGRVELLLVGHPVGLALAPGRGRHGGPRVVAVGRLTGDDDRDLAGRRVGPVREQGLLVEERDVLGGLGRDLGTGDGDARVGGADERDLARGLVPEEFVVRLQEVPAPCCATARPPGRPRPG
jgi:hypothetical protein